MRLAEGSGVHHPTGNGGSHRHRHQASDIDFQLLGPMRIRVSGVPVNVGPPKLRALLAALLLHAGRAVSTADLAEAIWGGDQPLNARRAVQVYVTRLRAQSGPAVAELISRSSDGYCIDVSPCQLDLTRVYRMVAEADEASVAGEMDTEAHLLMAALSAWQGEPLADVESDVLHRDFVPQIQELQLRILERKSEIQIRCGRQADVIAELYAATARHPLRERLWKHLALALHRDGRRAEALRAYHCLRQKLADELGVDPGEDLQALFAEILAGPAENNPNTGSPPVPRQLPADIRGFTGRSAELATLNELLDRHQHRGAPPAIAVVNGPAGVGKTTLAAHWARRVADRFPDGQLWVNMHAYDNAVPLTPERALTRLLRALGIPGEHVPLNLPDQTDLYRSMMDGRRILVVLDNANGPSEVRPLLPGAPGCFILVTSRRQMAGLVAAEAALPIPLGPLSRQDSYSLLAARIGKDRLEQEPRSADDIVSLSAGLPLALAIIGARAMVSPPGIGLETVARQMRAYRPTDADALQGGWANDLDTAFYWSYQALSPSAARLFRTLSIHPGQDFSGLAAASLAGMPPEHVVPLLGELCDTHLLTENQPQRYMFHDLLSVYAHRLRLVHDHVDEHDQAMNRLLDHYLFMAYAAGRQLGPYLEKGRFGPMHNGIATEQAGDHKSATAWFKAEHAAILSIMALASKAGKHSHVWNLAAALSEYLHRTGHWQDWVATQKQALLAAEQSGERSEMARAHRGLARAYLRMANLVKAERQCLMALAMSAELSDMHGRARAHMHLAVLKELRGHHREALDHDLQALILFQAEGERAWEARAANHVGWDYLHLGNVRQGLADCQKALEIMQRLGDRMGQAAPWDSLGYAHYQLGQHSQAIDSFENALEIYREFGVRYNEAEVLTHIGDTWASTGNLGRARASWQDALAILVDLQHPRLDALTVRLSDRRPARGRQLSRGSSVTVGRLTGPSQMRE